jgi:hypothetical protein
MSEAGLFSVLRMAVRVSVAALALVLFTGCATRMAGPLRAWGATREQTALVNAAATRLLEAARRDDWTEIESLIAADASLVLPAADTLRGRTAVTAALHRLAGPAGQLLVGFERARTRECSAALHATGVVSVRQNGAGGQEVGVWHLAMIWRVSGPSGPLLLHSVTVYPMLDFSAYTERRCLPLGDSIFAGSRFALVLTPGASALTSRGYTGDFDAELVRAGWDNPSGFYDDFFAEHSVKRFPLGAATVRYHFTPGLYTGATVATFGGSSIHTNQAIGRAEFEYSGLLAGVQAGVQHGWLFAATGPTYLRLSGDWHMLREYGGRAPGPPAHPHGWSLGLLSEAGLLVPLTLNAGLAVHGQHRYLPATELAGYRNSEPFSVNYSHTALLLSAVVRF